MAQQPSANVLQLGKTPTTTVLKLSWPAILEQIAFTVLNFSDTAMVGVLGATSTAAVGIVSPILWLTNGLIAALSVGLSVQVAHAIGAEDYQHSQRVIRQSMGFSLLFGAILSLLCLVLTPVLPTLLGAEPEVAPLARSYLWVVSFSMLFNSVEVVFAAILRCMGNTRAPMFANMTAILLNVVLNFLFIYPSRTVLWMGREFFIPGCGFGVAGAALGTVISIAIAGVLVVGTIASGRVGEGLALRWEGFWALFRLDGDILMRCAHLGVPVALERATMALGQIVYIRIVASMGTVAVAAHHLANQAESLSYLPAFGFSIAATTLVGQAVGARLKDEAKNFGRIAANMGLICMTFTGLLLFTLSAPLISLFTRDTEVIALGSRLLKIVAFAQPPQALAIIYAGAMRGAGDSRWPFYINLVGVWGIRVLFASIFTFAMGLGLEWVWVAMLMDICFRGVVCRRRFVSQRWFHE